VKRKQRARETRERILGAASAEFLRSGYAATTIRAIADSAGVSVPMIELAFGTKAQLLHATIRFAIRGDAAPLPMLEREWAQTARQTSSVDEFLAIVAAVLCESAARSAGLVIAAFEAANLDRSIDGLADRLRAQRTETAGWIVDGVIERSALRVGLSREHAIDIVWLLMDPHVFRALTRDRGWSRGQFERWFAESVGRLLLSSATTPRKRGDR
jgi:AcrR family transcriptional regulator